MVIVTAWLMRMPVLCCGYILLSLVMFMLDEDPVLKRSKCGIKVN